MILFKSESKSAAFYFAAEEYIMRFLRPDEPVLMLWSTGDTIMIGANQIAEAESDSAYAKSEEIEIVRRASGGGTIFTDEGTLQFTIILRHEAESDHRALVHEWLTGPVVETLARYGVSASPEGRNDIVIDGKKISGVAQCVRYGYICSHGSLLFNTDLEKLTRSLTVDRTKFETKAIASVHARVANISGYIEEKDLICFRDALTDTYKQMKECQTRSFDPEALEQIEKIMGDKFANPEWTYGREPAYTYSNKKRFPGGLIEVFLDIKGGEIRDARINGDFLSLLPVEELEIILKGIPYREDALKEVLGTIDVNAYLGSLDAAELLEVLL